MQQGSDKPTNFPGRPAAPFSNHPQSSTPFRSSGPPVGFVAPGTLQTPMPFSTSGPLAVPESSGFRPPQPPFVSSNGPLGPPPSSHLSQSSITQPQPQPQPPRFPPTGQAIPLRGPPLGPPAASPPGSLHSQAQVPAVPAGIPSQTVNLVPPRGNIPPPLTESQFAATRPPLQAPVYRNPSTIPRASVYQPPTDSQFTAPRPASQPPLQAFPTTYIPAVQPPFHSYQQGVMPPPPPSTGVPFGFTTRGQMQYPSAGPPIGGGLQGLVEDFQSLSVGSVPGSLDAGIDPTSLPRPLDGDREPTSILETYPLNCHPRFFRLTTHAIPSSQSLLSRWHLSLGAIVHPLAEAPDGEEVPIVNFGAAGVIRCRRCRTYVNPYVAFTDAGRKWRCNLCSLLNDVPAEYMCGLDATGRRLDINQRPELCKGSVEFVAPTEYMVRPPMPPLYFFLIDVSVTAARSGLLEVIAKTIKSCLDELPCFPRTQIGFLTFDSTLHFYCLKSSLVQPQMMVVSDLDDIFLPLPDDLLVNLSESRNVADAFLDSLPSMFQDNTNVESAFGPALKAALMIMSQLGGKLLVFQSTLPSLGVGRLRLRGDDLRVYGTDKEHTLRVPEDPFYKQMAAEFTKNQIAVDIYAFSDKYSDIASLGSLAKYSGGQVYYYPSFQASIHGEKLRHELARDINRETAWEAVMRIRCGKGVRFTTYHGHFMLRSTDLLALPAIDCDKAFAMQLSLEDTLMTTQTVYFQVALLYTSSSGERRIRVHTAAAPVVTELSEMYRQADTGAIISLLSRLAIENSLAHKLEDSRLLIQLKIVKGLKEYRNLYVVHHRLGGRLIFPESLKFLATYALSLSKSVALRGGYADASLDERCAVGYSMMILPVSRMLKLLYPSLLRVDEHLIKASDDFEETSSSLALTAHSLDPKGLYVYDDGFNFVIWFGSALPSDLTNNILGNFSAFPDLSKVTLCEQDNNVSRKLMRILNRLRQKDPSYYQLAHIIRQGEQPRESSLLLSKLVEDQTAGTSSYLDWILQIHRQLQNS
ncbi:uncharacterized protein A4U43_C01F27750 [Asparagus officinalis]|uniref:Protein transport protein Sec24-like At3g07100 n=1 Tax=Asparagus officinalis TaxID=4686 RepID=A0A5P1FV57_ASPOF|nr:protein transport protein Sec24-like At3g07100 [Asparagus officinalis]XP_020251608.1 protein transport protein Sec24-like At3g07100 [Asparagus officinalis]ONK81317.1 uncharacterized protein A4U43_C01F27750 [Asparagus officinalis]